MNDTSDNLTRDIDNPAQPDTRTFLAIDGSLDVRLKSTRSAAMRSPSANQLHQQLSRDAERLGLHAQTPWEEPVGDAVLQFCAASAGAGHLTDQLRAAAMRAYQQRPDDYDIVLGDLLPNEFTRHARDILARRQYFNNTHPTAAGDWGVFTSQLSESTQNQIRGLPTGLSILDERLDGLHGLTFIGGDKGVGKSSLAQQVAVAALKATPDLGVLIFALDMPKTKLYERMVCLEARVDYRLLHRADKPQNVARRIAQAQENLRESIAPRMRVIQRDFAYDLDESRKNATPQRRGITPRSVMNDCYRLMEASAVRRLLLVFDLFQKIDPHGDIADNAARDHYRLDVFSQVIGESVSSGQPYGFPILVTSEIRKDAARGELTRDDLKGDGRMASDADNILLMWPQSNSAAAHSTIIPTTLRIDKGREGVIRGDTQLWFEHPQFRFHETKPSRAANEAARLEQQALSADADDEQFDPLAE